jgi:uncharacterized protein with ParB-like and HNH nuclease domain
MHASETKLQKIIDGTTQYVVPLFQRAYSWEKKQWQDLWDDIKDLCESDNPRPHFMGSLVTMPTNSVPEGVSKCLLIDGQQRLTTIFIILAVIRDQANKNPDTTQLAAKIENTILVNPYETGLDRYKLLPTQNDREYFYQIIDDEEKTNSNSISKCYKYFDQEIKHSQLELTRIADIIRSSLSVVRVDLGADDDPYLVFESLNAKGKDLTQADLIRNYFFMRIHTDNQQTVYEKYWLPMQELLGENMTDFIRHYLTKSGTFVKENEVYYVLKEKAKDKDALSSLKDLCKFAEYYAKFLEPQLEKNETVSKYLQRIKRLDVGTVYPFLLNCYDDWTKKEITESEMINILQIIENFVIRRFICNIPTSGLNKVFPVLYSQSKDLVADTFTERLKLNLQKQNYPQDDKFREGLINISLYNRNRPEKAKLILESIEESADHKEQVSFDNLSIEHIMPQKLDDWWKNHLGEDWEDTHELLIHSLGNLTLTGYNSELSNKSFDIKKISLQESHLELNKYFHDQTSWRRDDIEKRTEILADICLKIWGYFGDRSIKTSKSSKVTGTTPKKLRFLGEEYSVKTWRDLLEITMNIIAESYPDEFEQIIDNFPRFVAWENKKFKENRQLKNGAYIRLNLLGKDIHTFCRKAIEFAEIPLDEWAIEYE